MMEKKKRNEVKKGRKAKREKKKKQNGREKGVLHRKLVLPFLERECPPSL